MKDFQKLSREKMRQVKAGSNGPCNVGGNCAFFTSLNEGESGTCTLVDSVCKCLADNGDWGLSPQCGAT
jgi:hypothetical protein